MQSSSTKQEVDYTQVSIFLTACVCVCVCVCSKCLSSKWFLPKNRGTILSFYRLKKVFIHIRVIVPKEITQLATILKFR